MPPVAPAVISGLRPPRATRMEEMEAAAENAKQPPNALTATDGTVYVSNTRRYRVQITAPETSYDSLGRKIGGGRQIEAQFDEGVFRNTPRNEPDPEIRALIDEVLQSNKYFGKFGDGAAHFWLASDQQTATETKRKKAALDTLRTLPAEEVAAFVAELKQGQSEDHKVAPLVRPIQAQQ